jgi:ABC-type phosphate transport system permease subunit
MASTDRFAWQIVGVHMPEINEHSNHERDRALNQITASAAAAAAVVANDIIHIKIDIAEIKTLIEKMDSRYITRREFDPVKSIVYGLVAIILIAVVGSLVALVIIE